ncbi:TPA: hypothetical protein QCU60_004343 [Bacillus cereus]|nr:hypothetical protein [Bacillus cereus]HDR6312356.1 hypothetical protein [Bacillus cereus]
MAYYLSPKQKSLSFGFIFNDSFPQYVVENEPLLLPDDTPNLNSPVPILNNVLSIGTGFKIIKTATYQISYSLSVNFKNRSESLDKLVFALLLNDSLISESLFTVHVSNTNINEIDIVNKTIVANLTASDLLQIMPIEINGTIEVTTASLTILEIERN